MAIRARRPGHWLRRAVVEGTSMSPALEPGDRVVVVRRVPWQRVAPGAVVALSDPGRPDRVLIKRVDALGADGSVVVAGDNPEASTDSRVFGPVPRHLIWGRAVYRYAPASRAGRIR